MESKGASARIVEPVVFQQQKVRYKRTAVYCRVSSRMDEQLRSITCPLCKAKTRLKLLPDTILKNYPLFCPKCKKEVIINAEHLEVTVANQKNNKTKPDA